MAEAMPSLSDYFGGNNGGFANFMTGWYDSVDGSSSWDDMSKESRQNVFNAYLTQYNNEYNARQAELAWEREQKAIQMQNEYNSPKNQMARYAEAGLNPGAIYGQISGGNQSGVAQYQPQRAESMTAVGDPRGTKEQKLQQSMDIIGTVSSMIKQISGALGDVEGVKNMDLQNQLLAAELPFKKSVAEWQDSYFNRSVDPTDVYQNYRLWQEKYNIAYPRANASALAGSRTYYQNWWNDTIAPLYQQLTGNKVALSGAQAGLAGYNQDLLNSVPAEVRGLVAFFLQMLQGFSLKK